MTLEERIKALMEGSTGAKSEAELIESNQLDEKKTETITTASGTTIKDEDDGDDKSDSDKTDYSQDPGPDEKNDVSTEGEPDESNDDSEKDDASDDESEDDSSDEKKPPFGKKPVAEDFSQNEYNNQHEQPGLKKKESMEKLTQKVSGDKQDDAGLNTKLKVGAGRKDGEGVKAAKTAGAAEPNAKNNVDQQSLETKPAKITVGEHVSAMFAGEELSEEFVSKASTIFEAAVSQMVEQRLEEEVAQLQEEFQVKLDEAVSEVQGELVEQIDGFLNSVVDQWIDDNAVALESGIKVEMVSGFIDGLKTLFKEHHIEVPEDKLDVVEEQAARIAELEEALVTLDEAHDTAEAEVIALTRKIVVESVGSDLTMGQKEKFASLVEGIEFTSEDEFVAKVETIKESYFPKQAKVTSEIVESANVVEGVKETSDVMTRYSTALSGPLKFR